MNIRFAVNDHVTLLHSEGIPAIVREVSADGRKVRLEVIGNSHSRAWLGLHWFETDRVRLGEKTSF